MKKNEDDFSSLGSFGGVSAGVVTNEGGFPPIGYHAGNGKFIFGSDMKSAVSKLGVVVLSKREFVEVTREGKTTRYSPYTKYDTIEGEKERVVQVVLLVGDKLYTMGNRSWTARAFWVNPIDVGKPNKHRDPLFDDGAWLRLLAYIKKIKEVTGKQTAPYCFEFTMSADSEQATVKSKADPSNTSEAFPIKLTSEFKFVGAERALEYEKMFIENGLDAWSKEYETPGGVSMDTPSFETEEEFLEESPSFSEDEIPF